MNPKTLIFIIFIANSKPLVHGAFCSCQAGFANAHAAKRPLVRTSTVAAPHARRRGHRPPTPTSSFVLGAIPDVSSLPTAPSFESITTSDAPPIFSRFGAAFASTTLTYLSLLLAYDRPRGSLAVPDPDSTLSIRPSNVPGAGLGLFASRPLPAGTVLGTYPGVIRPAAAFYDGKCRRHPNAVGYSWRFTDSRYVIDPTDCEGEIQDVCIGGSDVPLSYATFGAFFAFLGVNTALCRINEPPIGAGGCNVSARENLDRREVVFQLVQDVSAGQELYLDYGLDYDRSRYGP